MVFIATVLSEESMTTTNRGDSLPSSGARRDFKEETVRTNVSLESIGALVEGRHSNPFEVLGPHEVEEDGRRDRVTGVL